MKTNVNKTNVSIKFNSIEEYREIEKKLIELGYVNDEEWNESAIFIYYIEKGYVLLRENEFNIFVNRVIKEKTYNSLQEFLNNLVQ